MINSFTFYFDYYNLLDTLPNKKDRDMMFGAILDYVYKDIEPRLSGHNQAIFNTLKAQIDVSKNNAKRRTKTEPEKKPEENRKETGEKPKDKPEENKTSIFNFLFYISNFKFINNNQNLINKLEEWFKYKQERKEKYTEIGIKTLLKKIDANVEKYSVEVIIDLIEESMANNWQGIIWEKLEKKKSRNISREEQNRKAIEEFKKEMKDEK